MSIVELTTERLILRQWRECDRLPFAQLNGNPEVMKFFPNPLSREESDTLAQRCEALIKDRGWGFWAVERRADHTFLGLVGLHNPSAPLSFKPCIEVGWRLDKPYWGQGYATEAAKASLEFGFKSLGLSEIVSFTSVLNLRSQAVMQRLEMRRDPATFMHPSVTPGHPLEEHCLYRISKNQWDNTST